MKKSLSFLALLFIGSSFALAQTKTTLSAVGIDDQSQASRSEISPVNEPFPTFNFGAATPDTVYTFETGSLPSIAAGYTSGTAFERPISSNVWEVVQSTNTLNSGFSLRSGSIGDSTTTNMGFNVVISDTGGTVQFDYRVSTEQDFDKFYFVVDNVVVDSASGDTGWLTSPVYNLSAGEQYLDFYYTKNDSLSGGIDSVFVDNIAITGREVLVPVITDVQPRAAITGSEVTLYGKDFESTLTENVVTFNGVSATVVSVSDNQNKLVVEVPSVDPGNVTIDITVSETTYEYEDLFTVLSNSGGAKAFRSPQVLNSTANGANDVYSADLDGDGDLDVLSASYLDDKIAWYENNGDGTYGSETIISLLADGPEAVYAADLDGDGDIDVLSASLLDDEIAWYANNGDGTFATQSVISNLADFARDVLAADLDGDGDLDVVSASYNDNEIAWYENNGDGTFGTQVIISTLALGPRSISTGDIDGDGDQDIVSASYFDDKIAWYENNGDGSFAAQAIISTIADGAYGVELGDLDGDGDLDVLSASYLDSKIAWYENIGDSTFATQSVISTLSTNPYRVETGDLDGDGDLDVFSASSGDDEIAWYANNGDGTFATQSIITESASNARGVHAADLDGDGVLDVLSASYFDDKIALYKLTEIPSGVAIFDIQPASATPDSIVTIYGSNFDTTSSGNTVTFGTTSATVQSVNASGTQLVVQVPNISKGPVSVSVTANASSQTFANLFTVLEPSEGVFTSLRTISTAANSPTSLHAADLDGDGHMDIISASLTDDKIAWYPSNGDGTFGEQVIITVSANGAYKVHSADFDGDGDIDVLSSSYVDSKIAWYENDGTGSFSTEIIISNTVSSTRSAYSADLDNDGDMDVIGTAYGSDQILWYENNGVGGFSSGNLITNLTDGVWDVTTADVNGNGYQDIIAVSSNDDEVSVFLNNGNGTFGSQNIISISGDAPRGVYAADMDHDGDVDILTASYSDSEISLYKNTGSGSFGSQIIISTLTLNPNSVGAGDMNGDGLLDIVAGSYSDDEVSWFANNGDGTFGSQNIITNSADGVHDVLIEDIDQNGTLDLISANYVGNQISSFINLLSEPKFGITDVYPNSGSIGDTLYIKGKLFDANTSVTIGGESTFIETFTDTELKVVVPSVIPGNHKITVANSDTTASDTWHQRFTRYSDQPVYFDQPTVVRDSTIRQLTASDFNNDDLLDITSGSFTALFNDEPDFNFSSSVLTGNDRRHTVFDYNNDDINDLVISYTSSNIYLYPGLGDGSFGDLKTISYNGEFSFAYGVDHADINNDGNIDILLTSNTAYIYWMQNYGSGEFGQAQKLTSGGIDALPSNATITVNDLDDDGDIDLVVDGSNIYIYVNDGSGNFSLSRTITTDSQTFQTAVLDIDGDGDKDLINRTTFDLGFILNGGDLLFGSRIQFESNISSIWDIQVADIDGDSDLDVISTSSNGLYIHENVGALTFEKYIVRDGNSYNKVSLADFDSDGDMDILANNETLDQLEFYRNVIPSVAISKITPSAGAPGTIIDVYGSGFSQITAENTVTINGVEANILESNGTASSVYATHLSVEVPSASLGSATITVTTNDSSRSIANKFSILKRDEAIFSDIKIINNTITDPQIVRSGDFNGDGYKDIVVFSQNGSTYNTDWYANEGNGSFGSRQPLYTGQYYYDMVVVDIDQDGNDDVVATNGFEVRVFPNSGSGSFTSSYVIYNYSNNSSNGLFMFHLEAADLDGDGLNDLILSGRDNSNIGHVYWHKNNGDGTVSDFQDVLNLSTNYPSQLKVGDHDGDGDIDVIISYSNTEGSLHAVYNDGNGVFNVEPNNVIYSRANDYLRDFELQDFNKNGSLDVISTRNYVNDTYDDYVILFTTSSNGPAEQILSQSNGPIFDLELGDFNGDGNPDLLSSFTTNLLSVYLYNGEESPSNTDIVNLQTEVSGYYQIDAEVADFDNDGDLDVVMASSSDSTSTLAWYENEGVVVPLTSIASVRDTTIGEVVKVQGVVTRATDNVKKLQQDSAGLHLYTAADFNASLYNLNIVEGDSIEVTGEVGEYLGIRELINITTVTKLSSDNALPEPITVNTLGSNDFEQYESVLIQVNDLSTDSTAGTFNENTEYALTQNGTANSIPLAIGDSVSTHLISEVIPQKFNFTGVVYQSSETGTDGYSLFPINTDDITEIVGDRIPLAEAKSRTDSTLVKVRGIVTTPNFMTHTSTSFYIQEDEVGIHVFNNGDQARIVNIGDSVEVFGQIVTYNANRAIIVADPLNDIFTVNSNNTVPEPRVISFEQYKNAAFQDTDALGIQGSLVRVNNLITDPSTWPADTNAVSTNVTARNFEDSTITFRLYQGSDAITVTPSEFIDVVGIMGSFNGSQIYPRYSSDIIDIGIPGPRSVVAVENSTGIDLNWESSIASNIGGYNIYRSTSSFTDSSAVTKLNTSPVPNTSFSDNSVVANTTYYYRISAVDSTSGEVGELSREAATFYKLTDLFTASTEYAIPGDTLTLYGSNLSGTLANVSVTVGDSVAEVTNTSLNSIRLVVPTLTPGFYPIGATVNNIDLTLDETIVVLNTELNESGYFNSTEQIASYNSAPSLLSYNDLNEDTLSDLILFSGGSLSYALNNGDGTFATLTSTGLSFSETPSIAFNDLNRDGIQDLIYSDNSSNLLSWVEGNGDGTFSNTHVISSELSNISSIAILDVNKNSTADIVVSSTSSNEVILFSNYGFGTFSDSTQLVSSTAPNALEVTDINGDGLQDLILLAGNNNAYYLSNNGTGGFNTAVSLTQTATLDGLTKVIATNIDDDQTIDLLFMSENDNTVAWLPNNGDETFGTLTTISDSLSSVSDIEVLDSNGDGSQDLVITYLGDDNLYVYENDGFGSFTYRVEFGITDGYNLLTSFDIENDGDMDILASSLTQGILNALINKDAPPAAPTGLAITTGNGTATLVWDPNTDSDLLAYDVLRSTTSASSGYSSILETLQTDTTYQDSGLELGLTYHYQVVAIDSSLNRTTSEAVSIVGKATQITSITPLSGIAGTKIRINGILFSSTPSENSVSIGGVAASIVSSKENVIVAEIPASLTGYNSVNVTTNGASTTYPAKFEILTSNDGTYLAPSTLTGYSGSSHIEPIDLNDDSFMDLVITQSGFNRISFVTSSASNPAAQNNTYSFTNFSPSVVRTMSLFNAGLTDLVLISNTNQSFRILQDNGNSSRDRYTSHSFTISQASPQDVQVADMDRDGFNDVIIASSGDNTISWYANESTASSVSFGSANVITSTANGVNSIQPVDINEDGLMDVIAVKAGDGEIVWYKNDGNGSFTETFIVGSISFPEIVRTADLDNDGDLDVVYASSDGDFIGYVLNTSGTGDFGSSLTAATGLSGIEDFTLGDINGDGLIDIAGGSPNSGTAYWFENLGGGSGFAEGSLISDAYSSVDKILAYDYDSDGKLDIAVHDQTASQIEIAQNFEIVPISISTFTAGTNNIIRVNESMNLEFNNDLSAISGILTLITDNGVFRSIVDDQSFAIATSSINGNTITFEPNNLHTLDSLSLEINSQQIYEGTGGRYFIDVNENGVKDEADGLYTSPEFYTTVFGDFNNDINVNTNDLVLFRDAWYSNDTSKEIGPLSFVNLSFPYARLSPDNQFDIEDILSFIRYWNYSQENAAKEATILAKQKNSEITPDIKESLDASDISKGRIYENPSSDKVSKSANTNTLDFISYRKEQRATEYESDINADKQVTYTFGLNHPDTTIALSLLLEYNTEEIELVELEDQELYGEANTNDNIFLSYIDSTNGRVVLNVANFGELMKMDERDIVALTFKSLTNKDSELTVTSEIFAKGKPTHRQVAKQAIKVAEDLPKTFAISQNYPNPFNPTTTIHYELAEQARVNLSIYDILGRKVETIINGNNISPGYYRAKWDASRYASGMYIYVINVKSASGKSIMMSKKMMLVK